MLDAVASRRFGTVSRLLIALALVATALPSLAHADDRIGQRVFWKDSAQPRVGTEGVDPSLISSPATVTKVDGEWLWLERAWVRRSDIMTVEEAIELWTEQIRLQPDVAGAREGRALAWSEQGELERALTDLTEAIRLEPTRATTWNNRGTVWDRKGEFANAIKDYTEAIRLRPAYAAAHANRGLAHLALGRCAEAIEDCTEAMRLDPGSAQASVVRADARFQVGDYERALEDLAAARRIDATHPAATASLAWLRATCPNAAYRDGARAVELARQAGDLEGWAFPGTFDTLAAAHAEAGDFPAAVAAQERAIALQARTPSTLKDRKAFAAALELYMSGRPSRDEPGVEQP